jgi:thioredoxin 1
LCLKWVVDKLAAAGLLPTSVSEKLGKYSGIKNECCNTESEQTNSSSSSGCCAVDMPHITDADDFNKLMKESDKLVVAKATASWCRPCKEIQPAFARLAGKYGNTATFCTFDVDECEEIASNFSVSMMPTFLVLQPSDGSVVDKYAGSHEPTLSSFLAKTLQE